MLSLVSKILPCGNCHNLYEKLPQPPVHGNAYKAEKQPHSVVAEDGWSELEDKRQ